MISLVYIDVMTDTEPFQADLARCKELTMAHQFADALVLARRLLEHNADNMPLHLLLATLYARSDQMLEAMSHYILLAQFDPEFKEHHCRQLADGYRERGLTEPAAILAHAGAVKLKSKPLYQLAIEYYGQAGNQEAVGELQEALANI